jgi:hypothetical protein
VSKICKAIFIGKNSFIQRSLFTPIKCVCALCKFSSLVFFSFMQNGSKRVKIYFLIIEEHHNLPGLKLLIVSVFKKSTKIFNFLSQVCSKGLKRMPKDHHHHHHHHHNVNSKVIKVLFLRLLKKQIFSSHKNKLQCNKKKTFHRLTSSHYNFDV